MALQDPGWCETHPVGGSETAALRLVSVLRRFGHQADIVTEIEALKPSSTDVFVSLRDPRPLGLAALPGRLNYLWGHDDSNQTLVKVLEDKAVAEKLYERCDAVILLSHYQANRWMHDLHLPPSKIFLSSNGIPLEKFQVGRESLRQRAPRAYYASVPWRGLDTLLEAWPIIHGAVPEAELLIFSSVQVYQVGETEAQLHLYEQARSLPGVVYRGSVGQEELRQAAQTCRALAYPCVFPETSCIVAMEAMASGCVVVSTSLGALPETAWRNPLVPMGEGWLMTWAFEVARVFVDDDYYLDLARQNLSMATLLDWGHVAQRWLMRIRSDLARQGV